MTGIKLGFLFVLLSVFALVPAAASFDAESPNTEFTYARIRYHMTFEAAFDRETPWHHDYPYGDETFPSFVKEVTNIHTSAKSYQIVDIDSPELFKYPFAYLCEPGFLDLNEKDTKNFRDYLERGGFVLVDDFRGPAHLNHLVNEMKKVFPNREIVPLNISHPVFNSFYNLETLDVRPPYGRGPVQFFGLEDDHGRLVMIINYNHDLSEVWQWLDEGRASLHDAAESLKFGINYLMYDMTH
jgi:hypothetical protein